MKRFASQCAMLGLCALASVPQAWAEPISFSASVVTSPGVSLSSSYQYGGEYEVIQSYINIGNYVDEVVSRSAPYDFFTDATGQAYAFQDVTRRFGREITAIFAQQSYAYTYHWFDTEPGTGFNFVELSLDLPQEAASFHVYGTGLYGEVTHPRTGAEAKVLAAFALDGVSLTGWNNFAEDPSLWNSGYSGGPLSAGTHLLSVDNFPGGSVRYLQFAVYSKPTGAVEETRFEGSSTTYREMIMVATSPVPEPMPLLLTLAGCAVVLRLRKRAQAA